MSSQGCEVISVARWAMTSDLSSGPYRCEYLQLTRSNESPRKEEEERRKRRKSVKIEASVR